MINLHAHLIHLEQLLYTCLNNQEQYFEKKIYSIIGPGHF